MPNAGAVKQAFFGLERIADGNSDVGTLSRDIFQRLIDAGPQAGAQQQVLWRVAGKCQLGKHHQIGTGARGGSGPTDNTLSVTADITDMKIGLCKRDTECVCHEVPGWRGKAYCQKNRADRQIRITFHAHFL